MTVSDMDRSLDFYTRVLGFVRMSDEEIAGADFERLQGVFGARARVVRLGLGDERLDLIEYLAPRGRSIPADARANDAWFQHVAIVVSDMDRAYERLRTHRVTHASTGPQTLPAWNPNAGGIRAFYFKDPDGHTLEILQFPTGKGDTKWHKRSDALFLGIDHTAIVTRDTDLALALYRDVLGLRVAGESENWGDEQEHLNNVFGARLRITTLKGLVGPGIELLEYLAPRDGRPYPADAKPNDILHWQTRLTTRQLPAALGRLRSAHVPFVSPGLVELSHARLGFTAGVLVRDPDGHALQLTNPPPGTSPHQSPSRSPR
jgi:catechol 2,3-dioxygenase-like lactoylglutathione lyase family enzyme